MNFKYFNVLNVPQKSLEQNHKIKFRKNLGQHIVF